MIIFAKKKVESLEQILDIIFHASEQMEEDLKQKTGLKNLTSRQLFCIEKIRDLKNPNLSELALCMNIAKASMSVMTERLEKNKYIYKVPSDNDRRSTHFHLTEKGIKAAAIHSGIHRRISTLLTKNMTESEKEILNVLLNKSVTSLKETGNEFFIKNKC